MNKNISHAWCVGQRIVCIDGSFPSKATEVCDALPINGGIYTIRAVRETYEDVALLLKEIVNT